MMLKGSEVKSQISKGGAVGSANPFLLCIVPWTLRSYVRQTANRVTHRLGTRSLAERRAHESQTPRETVNHQQGKRGCGLNSGTEAGDTPFLELSL